MPTRGPAPEWLALLNTSLIVISGIFLLLGYYFIRQRQIELHKRSMLTATGFAALFLVVYVSRALLFETRVFAGEGLIRVVYLAILISHTILAILVGPFALVTLRRALRGEYAKHKHCQDHVPDVAVRRGHGLVDLLDAAYVLGGSVLISNVWGLPHVRRVEGWGCSGHRGGRRRGDGSGR